MVDPTTINLGLAVPVRGADVGTWDVPVNGDMTIIDACFGTVTAKSLTTGTVSLTASEAQANVLRFSGTLSGTVFVTIPTIVKGWIVENLCTVGAYAVVIGNASGGGVIGLPPGEAIDIFSDGTTVKYRNLARVGEYMDIGTAAVPAWISGSTIPPYLNCDGSSFSSGTYPALAALLGTTTLPDLRGRQRIALNQGTGRVTTANGGVDGNTRFAVGGNPSLAISQPELPAYSPTFTGTPAVLSVGSVLINSGFTGQIASGGAVRQLGDIFSPTINYTPGGTISPLGSGTPHINMDPSCVGGITMIRAA